MWGVVAPDMRAVPLTARGRRLGVDDGPMGAGGLLQTRLWALMPWRRSPCLRAGEAGELGGFLACFHR